jgi:hypothetical protein
MTGFLINYNASKEYRNRRPDPCFDEFTYGNRNQKASFIRNRISKDDKVFFHATLQTPDYGRYITACFVVEKIMEGFEARKDENIRKNFRNDHILNLTREPIDVIIFGNKDKSLDIRNNPVAFDRNLAERLTFNSEDDIIEFKEGLSDLSCIGYSTRAFRELTDASSAFLWNLCRNK